MTRAGPYHVLHVGMCVVDEVDLGVFSYIETLDPLSQHFSQKSNEVITRCLERTFALGQHLVAPFCNTNGLTHQATI